MSDSTRHGRHFLCAPPNVAAIFYIIAVSKIADKLHQRGAMVALQAISLRGADACQVL
ncbi:hypothetical protein V2W45_1396932 [Cenococcum geophilum]